MRSSTPARPLHALLGVLLFGSVSGWLGCTRECTELGCANGVNISLREPLSSSDEYTVRIKTPDDQFECTANVLDGPIGCWEVVFSISNGRLTGVSLYDYTPSSLHLSIESNGVVLVDTEVQGIRYRSYFVNGEDCDDVACKSADVQL